jgi:hypothetical protein
MLVGPFKLVDNTTGAFVRFPIYVCKCKQVGPGCGCSSCVALAIPGTQPAPGGLAS